jgi:hypothetical protein
MQSDLSRYGRAFAHLFTAAGLLAVAACTSTESGLTPVSGKVLLNGKPAEGAVVAFHPENGSDVNTMTPSGVTDSDGTFTLSTGQAKGAKPGKYVVTVICPDPNKKPTAAQKMQGMTDSDAPDLLGGRYASRAKSTLRAEVKFGESTVGPFEVK